MNSLEEYLDSIEPGSIEDPDKCARLLADCWREFEGSSDEATSSDKLTNRKLEKAEWHPPILSFAIERHGGTVHGSSKASLHHWQIDILKKAARIVKRSIRQLEPMSPRVDVKPIAEGVARAILNGKISPLLKWNSATDVVVRIGEIRELVGVAQTQQARRKRFRKALESILTDQGWRPMSGRFNRYERVVSTATECQ